ncbi:MAG: AMP-binding protein [Chromatiales bacterium]|nr:AMP-binding protein [Chromatiales bacterium]
MVEPSSWLSEQRMRGIERTALPANVWHLLRRNALERPEVAWLDFFEDADVLTYGDAADAIARTAAALAGLGIGRGSHVAVMVHTSRHYPLTWLALAALGAVTVPVNYGYTPRELAYMLDDSQAEAIVIAADLVPVLEAIEGPPRLGRDRVVVVGADLAGYPHRLERLTAEARADERLLGTFELDQPMNIQYTSGTTGMPKGAVQTHRYWLTFGRVGAAQFQDRLRRMLIAQPFYYVDAQWLALVAAWQGATAFVARRMQASRFLEWMRTHRIEYCNFPEVVSRQPPRADDHMDHLVVMSCYSHRPENYRVYESRYGGLARQGFSMTEVGCGLYVPMEADHMTGTGTVGIPVAFREAMVADAEGRPVPDGEIGELCIRGAGIFAEYWRKPEATRAAFHGDWFRTGDVARRDADGWFWYLGRRKDMVRRAGENVSAVEVEQVLRGVPEVLEAAVLPVPDETRGEEVKAYLRLVPGASGDDALLARVVAHCEANLARFKIPRYLTWVEDFPRTPSLKIRKSDLIAAAPDLRVGSYDRVERRWR